MKLLQPIRKLFRNVAIYSSKSFTLKSVFFFISPALYSFNSCIFLFFEAETLKQYAESFYGSATPLFIFSILVILAWKRMDIYDLIETTEKFIENRECWFKLTFFCSSYFKKRKHNFPFVWKEWKKIHFHEHHTNKLASESKFGRQYLSLPSTKWPFQEWCCQVFRWVYSIIIKVGWVKIPSYYHFRCGALLCCFNWKFLNIKPFFLPKVSIRLENANWLLDRMFIPSCRNLLHRSNIRL